MRENIIGREAEQQVLKEVYNSEISEFVAVCGRRRIGKTFLVKEYFEKEMVFQTAGMANSGIKEQIKTFYNDMLWAGLDQVEHDKPNDWIDVFFLLRKLLESMGEGRKVVLLDELPWMDTPRSGFVQALEHFWNSWACGRHDIVLVVCGSATSWMMDKLINNHGGLYNRLTRRIFLKPFTLDETEKFLQRKGFCMSHYDICICYMIMGGIPFYLNMLQPHLSLAQNIDTLFFNRYGAMYGEFPNLYVALFKNSSDYTNVVKVLCEKRCGLTRDEIISHTGLASGGGLSSILANLESCGFIRKYTTLSNVKSEMTIYQMTDFYTIFYYRFLSRMSTKSPLRTWSDVCGRPDFYVWAGNTFELLCIHAIDKIKERLGISGISTNELPWRGNSSQIDLLIDRSDNTLNLCEMKFTINEFTIDATYEANLRNKMARIMELTKGKKSIALTMITTFGLAANSHSGIVSNVLTIDDLF